MSEHTFSGEINGTEITYKVPDDEWEFHEKYVPQMMEHHLDGPLGLRLMPFHPINRRDQRLSEPFLQTSPLASLDTIRFIGEKIIGKDRVEEFVDDYRSTPGLVEARQADLDDGKNIGTYTNHLRIDDVLVMHGLELLALNKERNIANSACVMSKAITRLEVQVEDMAPLPATDVAALTGTSFFSIPKTASTYVLGMASGISEGSNPLMIGAMQYWLVSGGRKLGIALSGSTDKVLEDRIILQRVNPRAADLFAKLDQVLDIAVNLDAKPGKLWYKIGTHTDISHNNPEAVHMLMEYELALHVAEITGSQVDYEGEHWWQKAEAAQAREKIGDTAHRASDVAKRTTGKWVQTWQERRNRRWDEQHGNK